MTDILTAPGVQLTPPPPSLFTDISAAVDAFVAAALEPGDRGGLVGIATRKGDGSINVNLAVVQKIGDRSAIVGWVGKQGSWGSPVEGGVMWKTKW